MSKPRVLRIINRLNLGGPTFNVSYLTKYMEDEFETLLVAGMKSDAEASSSFIPEQLGIKPRFIEHMYREINFKNDYKAYQEIKAIIEEFKPDIVHTHAAKAGALGRLAAHHMKVPVIVHTFHGHVFHSYFSKLKTQLFLSIERYLAKKSTGIVAISPLQKKELTEDFAIASKSKFHVVPLGFDLNRFEINQSEKRAQFRTKWEIEEDTVAVGIVGRLTAIKNHHLFIDAIASLKAKTKQPFKALIIGGGEDDALLKAYANQKELWSEESNDNTIVFTSWITEIDIAMAGLDVVVLTSNNEGTPVSLIEAQAASKPVISTNVGGVTDIMVNGESGFVYAKGDTEGISNGMQTLVEDAEKRKRFGETGKKFVAERFTHKILAKNMQSLYNKLLNVK